MCSWLTSGADRREESSSVFPSGSTRLGAYGFSYENTKLVELATHERLFSVSYVDEIIFLQLEGDVCLINCCGGMSREIIVVIFEDPMGQLSLAASCY